MERVLFPEGDRDRRAHRQRERSIARAALAEFGMPGARLALLTDMENSTYRVDTADGGRYLLRVHRTAGNPLHLPRSVDEIRSELCWLAAIRRDIDLGVPEPVPTRDGAPLALIQTAEQPEPRSCTLLRWLEGRFFYAGLTPGHLERVGRFMARLHAHAAEWSPPDDFTRGRTGALSEAGAAYVVDFVAEHCDPAAVQVMLAVIRRLHETEQALDREPGAFGLIHGDLHQENYLFQRGEVGAVDFDDCGWGYLAYDLAVPLSEIRTRPDYLALRAALLRGYRSLRPFPPEHEPYTETFHALRVLQLTVWILERRHHPAFTGWREEVRDGLEELRRFVES